MPATRDGKTWRSQFYYEDWQGVRHKKNKRGFKTKAEAEEWERNFRQQQKKDYFIRSCIYNRICVVGKKEVIYKLVEELQNMQTNISELVKQLEQQDVTLTAEGLADMRNYCMDMLQAIISMLDGAKYLWQGAQTDKEKSPDSGNC